MKTTIIHHSADFDGLFCGQIAKKFLPEAEVIGWDFGDAELAFPSEGVVYILDLPVDRVFSWDYSKPQPREMSDRDKEIFSRIVWIDHHASSIASHPTTIPGYRIDGVAACRLAWQWFIGRDSMEQRRAVGLPPLPLKEEYVARKVSEPFALRLAGEYDIWDKRDARAEVFQFGLRSRDLTPFDWDELLSERIVPETEGTGMDISETDLLASSLLEAGYMLQRYQQRNDASVVNYRSFMMEFEGLKFLTLNTPRCNSLTFAAKDVPETGHDALCGFYWTGKSWKVSLYHARHRTDLDLSKIAVKYGGGGHKGACGFESKALPWIS